ncbi:hypothetical protein BCR43DRAFT_458339 [Syncephalastrum racemosum]|uniref:SH3 domain-containing protein n=1 Tax=Syncephalastrum racemosum TaxID=13706 RepID=A0A1X2HCY9_SYNRA|nr:hypothetical protein BCR43DRAFT_458339 [Syncephalastrum racemosum]
MTVPTPTYSLKNRRLVLLACLFSSLPTLVHSAGSCLSLQSSKACRSFTGYYVDLDSLELQYPYLANLSDVAAFDSALIEHFENVPDYLSLIGCATNETSPSYARYSLTRMCALLTQDSASLECNFARDIVPAPMCETDCLAWVNSVGDITQNMCNISDSTTALDNLANQCETWPGFSGTASRCIPGAENEPDNCGFLTDNDAACAYCQRNSTDTCCRRACRSTPLGAGAIAGISVGGAAGAILIGAGLIYLYRRRSRSRQGHAKEDAQSLLMGGKKDEERVHANSNTEPLLAVHDSQHLTEMTQRQPPSPVPSMEMVEAFCETMHNYPPQASDELSLTEGDIVYLIFQLDDGWGYGHNIMTAQSGVFPLMCVAPATEERLEQLLATSSPEFLSVNALAMDCNESYQHDKTLVEDDDSSKTPTSATSSVLAMRLQNIRENVRRSVSLSSMQRIQQNRLSRAAPPPPPIHESIPSSGTSMDMASSPEAYHLLTIHANNH